ncbi:hypothetical protein PSTEL_24760 [Paenibacillus stellifer]|uniref:Uncharacterized protein n=1 Tax=Paenibacillus stellifer TaxID=169760 RepID=A0A089NAF1_9BACL|nr:hypothetical protein PSTEL_24760 [Paenibacillus stellifer]
MTPLARWSECIHYLHRSPIPFRFIRKLTGKFTPRRIGDGFGQPVIFEHVRHSQIFDADRLIFTNQLRGELMQKIMAAAHDLFMDLGNLLFGFLPIGAPLVTASHAALPKCKFLLIFAKHFRIGNPPPIRADCKFLESKVNADLLIGLWQRVHFHFAKDGYKILACRISPQGSRKNATFTRSGVGKAKPAKLRKLQSISAKRNVVIGVFGGVALHRMLAAFEAWGLILFLEETFKAVCHVSHRRLQSNAIYRF